MKTKSKADKVRQAILDGKSTKEIMTECKVKASTVYNMRYRIQKEVKPKIRMMQLPKVASAPVTKYSEHLKAELATVDVQISQLQNISAFLNIRIQQLEMNGE